MTETTLTEVLVRHAIYSHYGIFRIAINDDTLQDLSGTETYQVSPQQVSLVEEPGTPMWVDRMARTRNVLVTAHTTLQEEHNRQTRHLEGLGEALLEQAERRDWCGEYDTFAEEWDLPKRAKEWDITMTVRVNARDEDTAIDMVRDKVNIQDYNMDSLVEGPEFSAEEA